MTLERVGIVVLGAVASAAWGGCSADSGTDERTSTSTGAVFQAPAGNNQGLYGGPWVFDTTASTTLPAVAVGALVKNGKGICTATAIQRNVILTAGHCFCPHNAAALNAANYSFWVPQMGAGFQNAVPGSGTVGWMMADPSNCADGEPSGATDASADLAVMYLSQNLTTAQLPEVAPVYTFGDLVDKLFNGSGAFSSPYQMTGWAAGDPADYFKVRATGTAGPDNKPVSFDHFCNVFGYNCDPLYIHMNGGVIEEGFSTKAGDSGGPLTLIRTSDNKPTIIAAFKGWWASPFTGNVAALNTWYLFSPTFDNGSGNGGFIRQVVDDADDDGVNDNFDNCPAAICTIQSKCKNPNQEDADSDGVGDVCDTCPNRSDPTQMDSDNDGVGDACDLCPMVIGQGTGKDDDGDGVGDSCDNCPGVYNPPAGCSGFNCIGSTAICIQDIGRCRSQSDADDDGVGNDCDACAGIQNNGLNANSNIDAELRESAAHDGDKCDRVPTFIARSVRQNVTTASFGPPEPVQGPTTPMIRNTLLMDATATIGRIPSSNKDGSESGPASGTVGFRFCDCYNPVTAKFRTKSQCLSQFLPCSTNPTDFDSPSNWKKVTVGSSFPSFNQTGVPKSTTEVRGGNLTRQAGYTGTLFTNTQLAYANADEQENARIGKREMIGWRWAEDLQSSGLGGDIQAHTFPAGGPLHVGGMFWSHTLTNPGAFFSGRDLASGGRLRDHYTYASSLQFKLTLSQLPGTNDCYGAGCGFTWDPDILSVQPVDPDPLETFGLIDHLTFPAVLTMLDAKVAALSGSTHPTFDVTSLVTPTIQALLAAPHVAWFTPVERSDRLRESGLATRAVAIANPWLASSPVAEVVLTPEGSLSVARTAETVACGAGQVLARCSGGLRCVVPCDGIQGNSPGGTADPTCTLQANRAISDESPFTCQTTTALQCPAGEVACSTDCFLPCDGTIGCVPNGKFGDELPALCGTNTGGTAAALMQAAFSEPAFADEATSEFVPGDRSGMVGLLSATERALFLIGGRRDDGPTSEIWGYDLDHRSWSHLFRFTPLAPQDVISAAYDYRNRRLFVLDEFGVEDGPGVGEDWSFGGPATPNQALGNGLVKQLMKLRRARLALHNLDTGESVLLKSWIRLNLYDRIALVAQDDGSLVVVASHSKMNSTFVYLATASGNQLSWKGLRMLSGKLVFQPSLSERGVLVPTLTKTGVFEINVVSPTDFAPHWKGMEEL